MKYTYFISYSHNRGFGNTKVILDYKINSIKNYEILNAFIRKGDIVADIVILNFILLEEDIK